uniref:IS1 family transposase n=1 Tax=Flavobacterium soli TaxID=344881 RepID=UPI0038B39A68
MCKYCRDFTRKATPFAAANNPPQEGNFGTNHIERNNLTLRTHLKRLNRRAICFSKSLIVLVFVLKIYFWS